MKTSLFACPRALVGPLLICLGFGSPLRATDWWQGAAAPADPSGYWHLSWFGDFRFLDDGVIEHRTLGELAVVADSPDTVWFYDNDFGWLFTGRATFPWMYATARAGWLYYQPDSINPRWFYNPAAPFTNTTKWLASPRLTFDSVWPRLPSGHPRLYLSADQLSAVRARYFSSAFTASRNTIRARAAENPGGGSAWQTIPARAFMYLMGDDGATTVPLPQSDAAVRTFGSTALNKAVSYLSAAGDYAAANPQDTSGAYAFGNQIEDNPLHMAAIAYDWCYDLLTPSQKHACLKGVANVAAVAATHRPGPGYPPAATANFISSHVTEWFFGGYLQIAAAIGDDDGRQFWWLANQAYQQEAGPVLEYFSTAHMHHQGIDYGRWRHLREMSAVLTLRSLDGQRFAGPDFEQVANQWVYHLRPDGYYLLSGDSGGSGAPAPSSKDWAIYILGGAAFRQPELLRLADSGIASAAIGLFHCFNVIYRDGSAPRTRGRRPTAREYFSEGSPRDRASTSGPVLSTLPKTRLFPAPMNEMIVRTGWSIAGVNYADNPASRPADVLAHLRVGDRWFGNHQHRDWGTFQLFYKVPLTGPRGVYDDYGTDHYRDFYSDTTATNGLLILDPGEVQADSIGGRGFPNTGGQRTPSLSAGYHLFPLSQLSSPADSMGTLTAAGFGPDPLSPAYSFIEGDITAAYAAPIRPKVSLVTRSMLFWNTGSAACPGVLMVWDRVRSTNAAFAKTWLLQSWAQPVISGRTITAIGYQGLVPRTSLGDASKPIAQLVATTLLPAAVTHAAFGGGSRGCWVRPLGQNVPPSGKYGGLQSENGWRTEVSPTVANIEDVFLHTLVAMDYGGTPPASARKGESGLEADEASEIAATFADTQFAVAACYSALGPDRSTATVTLPAVAGRPWRVLFLHLAPGAYAITGSVTGAGTVTPDSRSLYVQAAHAGSTTFTVTRQ